MNLNLRQDGSPKGGDGLPAPFTTAVSRQGRRPGRYLFYISQKINTGRYIQQNVG
ncbi:hypothetical protein SeSPB_B0152 [Salmonella enterica subsp. enterica serovar Saintpaul str. SARA29]|nr:hypothetical protein SeSPB_B0152 [Salmonella enterica subsp. enterica serovar Saintpaul str. SARA29]